MGYRSDITVALTKEVIMKQLILPNEGYTNLVEYTDDIFDKDTYAVYQINRIKWYESYPEINSINEFLDQLNDEEYGFIRLGEELDDTEKKGSPYDFDMYINREVCF